MQTRWLAIHFVEQNSKFQSLERSSRFNH